MKKKILILVSLWIAGIGLVYADSTTSRLSLTKPSIGSLGWGVKWNSNADLLDAGVYVLTGTNTDQSTTTVNGSVINGTKTDNSTTTYTVNPSIPYWSYKRPRLVWNSVSRVDIETNTATSNTTSIMFPDGQVRTVTENLATTQNYHSFKPSQNAAFASGTIQGGLRSSLTATANTWYAMYAVKCTKAGETTNYVLVGDTFTPVATNFSTLNTNFGTNGWVYLGMIRYGDSGLNTTIVLQFNQSGNSTVFTTTQTNNGNALSGQGVVLATTGGATSSTWTYVSGTSGVQIPPNILQGTIFAGHGSTTVNVAVRYGVNTGPSVLVVPLGTAAGFAGAAKGQSPLDANLYMVPIPTTSMALDLYLTGFIDDALSPR